MQAKLLGDLVHVVGEAAAAKRRHRIFALTWSFENVAGRVDLALNISGFSRHADFVLDGVVERLELVVIERPVFERCAFGDRTLTVALDNFAAGLEVPCLETPAL